MEDEEIIETILEKHSANIKDIVQIFRELINNSDYDLVEDPKEGWKNITYKKDKIICYIQPFKNHINLGFYNGASLDDPNNLLKGTGKNLRHIKVRSEENIREKQILELL